MQFTSWVNSPELLYLLFNELSLRLSTWVLWKCQIAIKASKCILSNSVFIWQFRHKRFTDWHHLRNALWRALINVAFSPSALGWLSPPPHLQFYSLPFLPCSVLRRLICIDCDLLPSDILLYLANGYNQQEMEGQEKKMECLFLQLFLHRGLLVYVLLLKAKAPVR